MAFFSDVAVDGVLVAAGISVCCWSLLADLLLLVKKVVNYFLKLFLYKNLSGFLF
jgi:hypothetical protein